jgi:hypothetical protein
MLPNSLYPCMSFSRSSFMYCIRFFQSSSACACPTKEKLTFWIYSMTRKNSARCSITEPPVRGFARMGSDGFPVAQTNSNPNCEGGKFREDDRCYRAFKIRIMDQNRVRIMLRQFLELRAHRHRSEKLRISSRHLWSPNFDKLVL